MWTVEGTCGVAEAELDPLRVTGVSAVGSLESARITSLLSETDKQRRPVNQVMLMGGPMQVLQSHREGRVFQHLFQGGCCAFNCNSTSPHSKGQAVSMVCNPSPPAAVAWPDMVTWLIWMSLSLLGSSLPLAGPGTATSGLERDPDGRASFEGRRSLPRNLNH